IDTHTHTCTHMHTHSTKTHISSCTQGAPSSVRRHIHLHTNTHTTSQSAPLTFQTNIFPLSNTGIQTQGRLPHKAHMAMRHSHYDVFKCKPAVHSMFPTHSCLQRHDVMSTCPRV